MKLSLSLSVSLSLFLPHFLSLFLEHHWRRWIFIVLFRFFSILTLEKTLRVGGSATAGPPALIGCLDDWRQRRLLPLYFGGCRMSSGAGQVVFMQMNEHITVCSSFWFKH